MVLQLFPRPDRVQLKRTLQLQLCKEGALLVKMVFEKKGKEQEQEQSQ